jgi:hypothetical protein
MPTGGGSGGGSRVRLETLNPGALSQKVQGDCAEATVNGKNAASRFVSLSMLQKAFSRAIQLQADVSRVMSTAWKCSVNSIEVFRLRKAAASPEAKLGNLPERTSLLLL